MKVLGEIGIFREADLSRIAKDIIDSYHYEEDFLSELLQNATDSIRRTGRSTGNKIHVIYDALKGRFTVIDNGTGMSEDELKLFAIGKTDKPGDLQQLLIGEKGVGGSYVLLMSDFFEVESVKNGKKVRAICEKARDAVYSGKEPILKIVERADTSEENYTKISVEGIGFKRYSDIDTLVEDLRMFTSVGNTKIALGEKDIDIEVKATFIGRDEIGREIAISKPVKFCFLHPAIEYPDMMIKFEQLEEDTKKGIKYPDGHFENKFLEILDRERQIYAVFGREELLKEYKIPPMIVLGVKGAPMPVVIRPPRTGAAGYWRNLFVLINRDEVRLDIGRKSIARPDMDKIHKSLKDFFNEKVVKYAKLFIKPRTVATLDQLKDQARNKEDLHIPGIPYLKVPAKGEELSVMSIFHEMVGKGLLKGYQTLSESSDAPYDAIMRYTVKISDLGPYAQKMIKRVLRKIKQKQVYQVEGFVEFKVDATDFMTDCDKGKKRLEEVMLVVAYDLDRKKIKRGWKVEPIREEERIFDGAKFKLVHIGLNREVPLILLKEFRSSPQA